MTKLLRDNIKVIWSVVGITVLLLLGMELISTTYLFLRQSGRETIDNRVRADSYEGTEWVEAYFKEFNASNYFAWTPYVYWRRKPFEGSYINIDSLGVRRSWNPVSSEGVHRSGKIKIFVFGGSTMWGTGARDDYTISSFISRILSEENGHDVEIVNFGESGYVNTQEVVLLIGELQRRNVPDLVIFYDGFNDTHAASQSGIPGFPLNEVNRKKEFNILNAKESGWRTRLVREASLALVQYSGSYRLFSGVLQKMGVQTTGKFRPTSSSNSGTTVQQLAKGLVQIYSGNMKIVEELGKGFGFKAIFYWQPIIF